MEMAHLLREKKLEDIPLDLCGVAQIKKGLKEKTSSS